MSTNADPLGWVADYKTALAIPDSGRAGTIVVTALVPALAGARAALTKARAALAERTYEPLLTSLDEATMRAQILAFTAHVFTSFIRSLENAPAEPALLTPATSELEELAREELHADGAEDAVTARLKAAPGAIDTAIAAVDQALAAWNNAAEDGSHFEREVAALSEALPPFVTQLRMTSLVFRGG